MPFDAILGQEQAVGSLRGVLAGGRVPSAVLFLGPHHVGKRTTALALAQALNCQGRDGDGCGRCPPCRKIEEAVHPDVEVVEPDGQFIRIDRSEWFRVAGFGHTGACGGIYIVRR